MLSPQMFGRAGCVLPGSVTQPGRLLLGSAEKAKRERHVLGDASFARAGRASRGAAGVPRAESSVRTFSARGRWWEALGGSRQSLHSYPCVSVS